VSATRTYWVAGYALATQTSFPTVRLEDKLYGEILKVLASGETWTQLPTGSALRTVDSLSAQTGEEPVGSELAEALAAHPKNADMCIIDLRPAAMTGEIRPVFPRSYAVVAEKLRELFDKGGLGKSQVLVIVPKLGKKGEFQLKHFAHLSETRPLSILDQSGEVWTEQFPEVDRAGIAALFEQGIAEPKEALERKMIRRRGVFPRFNLEGETDGHTRNFFDAHYCGEELRALLADEISTALNGARPLTIVYSEAPSHWLEPALLNAMSDLTVRDSGLRSDLNLVAYPELRESKGESVRDVLAVVPVVDRGDSLRELIAAIKEWAPAAKIVAVSVVSTRDMAEHRSDFGDVAPRCLMTAKQELALPMVAPDSSYYEASTDGTERFLPFTSLEFWELASQAGFIEERDRPENRSGLKWVPDLLEFMHQNAAWVASKIETAVKQFTGRDITEVSVALVNNETAASKLSEVLAETVGNAPLGVPREALYAWRAKTGNKNALLKKWRKEGADWLLAVEAASVNRLVIIDEFSYSGRTLEDMASLLTAANFEVLLALTIANFSRSSLNRAVQDHKAFAFYETEWRRPETQKLIEAG
jgi:hypoxanthine phosphoribosyltransferase